MDLMLLIVEQVSADVRETHDQIVALEDKIKSSTQIDFDSILDSIKTSTAKYRDNLKEVKLKKYKRDTEDYLRNEVYPWDISSAATATISNTSNGASRETNQVRGSSRTTSRFRKHSRETGSPYDFGPSDSTENEFTMDSDSSAQGSTSFLGRRAPLCRPERRKNAEEAQGRQRNVRPWTRSFSKRR